VLRKRVKINGIDIGLIKCYIPPTGFFPLYNIERSLYFEIEERPKHYKKDRYIHPHIGSGSACLGGYYPMLDAARKNFDIYTFVLLLDQFLGSYEEDSAFEKLENWDERYILDHDTNEFILKENHVSTS
jgi:hypothetical protein